MDKIWANVLKGLREGGHTALFALVNSVDDIEFTTFNITLRPANDTETMTLKNNLGTLQQFAGGDYIVIVPKEKKDANTREYIEKLGDLFGEKLLIK